MANFYYKDTMQPITSQEALEEAIESKNAVVDYDYYYMKCSKAIQEKEIIMGNIDAMINTATNGVRKIYKNKVNQSRGLSKKEARSDPGYIFYSCRCSKLRLKKEDYEVFETSITTPYMVEDFPMSDIADMVFSDVEQGQFLQTINVKFMDSIDSLKNYNYFEKLLEENLDEDKILRLFQTNNYPIHFEIEAYREFFKIKFLTFNPTV